MLKLLAIYFILIIPSFAWAQNMEGLVARFSFNQGAAQNDLNTSHAKAVGATVTEDRFGNTGAAYYLHGSGGSYLNLGTEPILKPSAGSISIWFKMDNIVYAGKGYSGNPLLLTKTYAGDDFFEAYGLGIDFTSKKLNIVCSRVIPGDSIQTGARTIKSIELSRWYHAVMCYNNSSIWLYLDGVLQNCVSKNFHTAFLAGDSVLVGYTGNTKNVRFFNGSVDDIEIYDRVLTPAEVINLYKAPDPNKNHYVVRLLIIISLSALGVMLLMLLLLKRERLKNRRQQQVYEMEMQVIKAQMNPHFIFNAINSVQLLILAQDTENAYKYLVKFSRLVRMILESNHQENISLENEIYILTRYIEIEALRFENSFSYEIVTEAEINTEGVRIPQMMIQPLVENAIWHGLLPKKDNRRLSIQFKYINKKMLTCIIDDNGVGRRKKKPEEAVSKRRSLAISFIYQRLKLMSREWKMDFNIKIIDKENKDATSAGTQVIIHLPILN